MNGCRYQFQKVSEISGLIGMDGWLYRRLAVTAVAHGWVWAAIHIFIFIYIDVRMDG
jgi:hypothetical protein